MSSIEAQHSRRRRSRQTNNRVPWNKKDQISKLSFFLMNVQVKFSQMIWSICFSCVRLKMSTQHGYMSAALHYDPWELRSLRLLNLGPFCDLQKLYLFFFIIVVCHSISMRKGDLKKIAQLRSGGSSSCECSEAKESSERRD